LVSNYAELMWRLLPAVRKRKSPAESRLYGLLEAIGAVLDALRTAILTARLRRYALVGSPDDTYYGSPARSADLEMHALDRGLRRLPSESDSELLERIATLPYRNRFLGTKMGMKYLIEEIHSLRCEQIVEYYADDQAWLILNRDDQAGEVETNISHLFNLGESEANEGYRQTRIYSRSDLSQAFHFWVSVSNPRCINYDPDVVIQAVNAAKPAHSRAVVHFQG